MNNSLEITKEILIALVQTNKMHTPIIRNTENTDELSKKNHMLADQVSILFKTIHAAVKECE